MADERVSSTAPTTVALSHLAQRIVTEVAPDQGDYLQAVTAALETGDRRARLLGGAVGSGVEPTVLADLIYPLLTGTVAQVLGAAGFAAVQRRKRWRRKNKGGPRPSTTISITAAQIAPMREACLAHGQVLGLSPEEATLLADALERALLRSQDER
ncbi:hypothetical protein JOD54_004093 [Actinokineospora baliensis]|uniref:hypothetical protein n=1 Tax=Actinokineospora baliensis TaxID=547056 RepID=UPI001959036A|nr:hypothetical protein [Actinokineospora baliensis]MBM7773889.1 hypothetical protein [Actinokineospora baliensis]